MKLTEENRNLSSYCSKLKDEFMHPSQQLEEMSVNDTARLDYNRKYFTNDTFQNIYYYLLNTKDSNSEWMAPNEFARQLPNPIAWFLQSYQAHFDYCKQNEKEIDSKACALSWFL